jgi:hypothetical protein
VREDPNLVANGWFQAWWPLEGEGEASFSPFSLSPQQILLKLFFSLILKFYFTMVLHSYFTSFPPFP